MARRKPSPRSRSSRRSVGGRIASFLRIPFFAVLGLLALLAISETSPVADLIAGVRPSSPLVGLVAGHWQNDSGAVCPDGLQEAEINLDIARRVASLLRRKGYRAEVLPEFSPKLNGYQAAALLAIHSDSCLEEFSGFKVARMTHAQSPEVEDRLVAALYESYEKATGLKPHLDTITEDMRQYHALRRIAPDTPGAIIECGFMGGDRRILTEQPDRVAEGIANGLIAFLAEQREQTGPTPTP